MKKDIAIRPMEYVGVAAVAPDVAGEELWDIYLFNFQDIAIRNILVTSRGYGIVDGEQLETSSFRYFIDNLGALEFTKIEPIHIELFGLNNEYWVSFQSHDYMYDKKFTFVANSIPEAELTLIPFLNKMGYMIQ